MAEAEPALPPARHEARDIGEGFIWTAVASMAVLLLLCAGVSYWRYPQSRLDRTLSMPLPTYPAPRLQSDPAADMRVFHDEEMLRLNSRGADPQGSAHIPIEEAMHEVAREGIAGWPRAPLSPLPESP